MSKHDGAPPAHHQSDHVVHEVFGPAFGGVEAGAAIALGVVSLLIAGVLPILLGALADEHRLSAVGIGLSVTGEALTMGLVTGLVGIVLKARHLRMVALLSTLALAAIDLATVRMQDTSGVMIVRALAGIPEGFLLWITIGMIARTQTPERWAGVLFTALTCAQLAISTAFAAIVLPRFNANGGFICLAAISLIGLAVSRFIPNHYPALPDTGEGGGGSPPPRGWVALAGTLFLVSSAGAVSIYLVPLAHQLGLSANVARTANSAALAAQILGAALATAVAGRVHYFRVFVIGTVLSLAMWAVYGFSTSAAVFIMATSALGFVSIFINPFLVPMTIEADPSRRAAVQSGAAQLLGGALGPLLASQVVSDRNVHGALYLGAGLLLTGLAVIAYLHFTAKPARAIAAQD
jgi:predicted MFS family arabinose efflux permease